MFFDAHSHAHFAAYGNETDAVIKRALDAGVWMINVGTQKDTSRGAVEIANRYPQGVYAAVGIHPTHTTPAEYVDLGFGFTFGGVVTFTRDYDEVVRYAPLDRILSETDAPYVAPVPYRGRRNEPAYVIETVK